MKKNMGPADRIIRILLAALFAPISILEESLQVRGELFLSC